MSLPRKVTVRCCDIDCAAAAWQRTIGDVFRVACLTTHSLSRIASNLLNKGWAGVAVQRWNLGDIPRFGDEAF